MWCNYFLCFCGCVVVDDAMIAAGYIAPQSGIPVGRIFRKACASKDMPLKTAAIWMGGPHYEATLSRAIHGLGPLDLHAVVKLPLTLVFRIFRLLLAAKLKAWETEATDERKRA